MQEIQKRSPWVAIVIGLVVLGMIATYSSLFSGNSNQNTNVGKIEVAQSIQYQGKDNIDALTILKETHSVDASDQGFVNSIDGVKPAEKQYWALYINGQLADKGAKDIITKSSDKIEWKLDSF